MTKTSTIGDYYEMFTKDTTDPYEIHVCQDNRTDFAASLHVDNPSLQLIYVQE